MVELEDFPKSLQEHAKRQFIKASELVDELVQTKYFEDQNTYPPSVMFFALTMLQKEYKAFMIQQSPLPDMGKYITDKLEHDLEDWINTKQDLKSKIQKEGHGIAIPIGSQTAKEILDLIKKHVKQGYGDKIQ